MEKKFDLYRANDTMELIGHSVLWEHIDGQSFNELIRAHSENQSDFKHVIVDAMILGMIWGIRLERAKRHRGTID